MTSIGCTNCANTTNMQLTAVTAPNVIVVKCPSCGESTAIVMQPEGRK